METGRSRIYQYFIQDPLRNGRELHGGSVRRFGERKTLSQNIRLFMEKIGSFKATMTRAQKIREVIEQINGKLVIMQEELSKILLQV